MTPELARAYLANTITGMSLDQLKKIIMNPGERYPEEVGMVVLGGQEGAADIPINDQVMVPKAQSNTGRSPPPPCPVTAPTVLPVATENLETISMDGDEGTGQAISRKRKLGPFEATSSTDNKSARINSPNPPLRQSSSNSKDIAQPNQEKLDVLVAGAMDSTKARLLRLAIVMDKLDWALVRTRSDVYNYLSEGEDELCRDLAHDPSTYMNKKIIGSFVYRHNIKLGVYNTAFIKPFQSLGHPLYRFTEPQSLVANVNPSPPPPQNPVQTEPPRSRSAPPLDWAVVSAHFKLLDKQETETSVAAIAEAFQISYRDITRRYDTDDTKIGDIVKLISRTTELATNMTQARPRGIYNRLMTGEPFVELRKCVMKLCSILVKQDKAVMRNMLRSRRDQLYSKMVKLS